MIEYNKKDYYMKTIESINRRFSLDTVYAYRVYGLVQIEQPPVLLNANCDDFPSNPKLRTIQEWLSLNGIRCDIDPKSEESIIEIGLRKDVRTETKFAAALVRTLVAFFEDKLVLRKTFKIPKIQLKENIKRKLKPKAKTRLTKKMKIGLTEIPRRPSNLRYSWQHENQNQYYSHCEWR